MHEIAGAPEASTPKQETRAMLGGHAVLVQRAIPTGVAY